MRIIVAVVGIMFVLLAIPSYTYFPSIITNAVNKLTASSTPSAMNNLIFSQLGVPSIDTITKFIQYSCLALAATGIGTIIYGIISKKAPKQDTVRLSIDPMKRIDSIEDANNPKALHLLQERFAKGEISSKQYQGIKKLLEEKI